MLAKTDSSPRAGPSRPPGLPPMLDYRPPPPPPPSTPIFSKVAFWLAITSMVLTVWTDFQWAFTGTYLPGVKDLGLPLLPRHFPIPYGLLVPPVAAFLLAIGGYFARPLGANISTGQRRALRTSAAALLVLLGYPLLAFILSVLIMGMAGSSH